MDDLKKKGADDRTKINMNEAWEVDFWTHELAVSKDELQKVIDKVGNSTAAVRRELGQYGLLVKRRMAIRLSTLGGVAGLWLSIPIKVRPDIGPRDPHAAQPGFQIDGRLADTLRWVNMANESLSHRLAFTERLSHDDGHYHLSLSEYRDERPTSVR